MHPHLLHNGLVRDTRQLLLSPGQVGFLNGWGVFSTLRVADGVLFAFERHFARMHRDAELMRVPFPHKPEQLERQLLLLVEANEAHNATLRVAIVRNKGGLFESPGLQHEVDLVAFTADLRSWGNGVHLSYKPHARYGASPHAGTKITSWAQNLAWYEEAHSAGFDEFILLNEEGQVSECTSANIFAIQGNEIGTPPLGTSGCLPGVTRALLLEELQLAGLHIREREISPSELEGSDGVFITSSTRDLLPVLAIDGLELKQAPAVIDRLAKAFKQCRDNYVVERERSGASMLRA